ncbi:PRC-barrel domain-containing protein [Kribbella sancticallisti]
MMSSFDPWNYRQDAGYTQGSDIVGYKIAATDGDIGKVDKATYETDSSSIVVDTGPWILGRKVLLPAGVVQSIDTDDEKVYVDRTKEEIKNAPEYDPDLPDGDAESRDRLGNYYRDYYQPGM